MLVYGRNYDELMQTTDLVLMPCIYHALCQEIFCMGLPVSVMVIESFKRANGQLMFVTRVIYSNLLKIDEFIELAVKRYIEGYGTNEME